MIKKYFVELLGTFSLTLAVLLSLSHGFPVPTPLIAGLTLGIFVYTLGHVSGMHINPAVTLGLYSAGKIRTRETISYIISQFIGAGLAMLLGRSLVGLPSVIAGSGLNLYMAEAIGAFFLLLAVSAVVNNKVSEQMSGLVIGGSLALGALLASVVSNGVLNPAVAFGIGSFSLPYIVGPIVGALLGVWVYREWVA